MKSIAPLTCLCIGAISTFIASYAAPVSAQQKTFTYTVKEGDKCTTLAEKFYGGREHYIQIHRMNPQLGPTPHRLRPGQKLTLPLLRTDPDAKVTRKRGQVRSQRPSAANWKNAAIGQDLFRSWRVNSLEGASAELTFLDDSRVYMRENTLVVIYGATNSKVRRRTTEAELQYGSLRTRLASVSKPEDPKPDETPSFQVTTPASEARMAAANALITVEKSGTTRIANHKGKGVKVVSRRKRKRNEKPKEVVVNEGMGSKVEPNKDPTPPKPLPPTPAWATPETYTVLIPAGSSSGATLSWEPVDAAATYRVEFFKDNARSESLGSITVDDPSITNINLQQPPGAYFVAVAAIDNDKFESKPSKLVSLNIQSVQLNAPDGSPVTDLAAIPIGSKVTTPEGTSCTANGSSVAKDFALVASSSLVCKDSKGQESAPLQLNVPTLTIQAAPNLSVDVLPRTQQTLVKLSFSSSPGETISVSSKDDMRVGTPKKLSDVSWNIPVTPGEDAPKTAQLDIFTGQGPSAVQIGSVNLVVEDDGPAFFTLETGLSFGAGYFTGTEDVPTVSSGRLMLSPTLHITGLFDEFFGFELEGRFSLDNENSDSLAGYRAHVLVQILRGTTKPFILIGHGSDYSIANDDPRRSINYLGGGSRFDLTESFGLRFDVRAEFLTLKETDINPQFSGLGGVFFRF